MEEALFVGYRSFNFTDNQGKKVEGVTLFLLQPIKKGEGVKGYQPVTLYDRFNNRMKFPSVSFEFFKTSCLVDLKPNTPILVTFDRNNKIIEVKTR